MGGAPPTCQALVPVERQSLDLFHSKMKKAMHIQFSLTNKPRDLHKYPMIWFFDTKDKIKEDKLENHHINNVEVLASHVLALKFRIFFFFFLNSKRRVLLCFCEGPKTKDSPQNQPKCFFFFFLIPFPVTPLTESYSLEILLSSRRATRLQCSVHCDTVDSSHTQANGSGSLSRPRSCSASQGPDAWARLSGGRKVWRTVSVAFPHSRNGLLGPDVSPSGFPSHSDLLCLPVSLFLPLRIGILSTHLSYHRTVLSWTWKCWIVFCFLKGPRAHVASSLQKPAGGVLSSAGVAKALGILKDQMNAVLTVKYMWVTGSQG